MPWQDPKWRDARIFLEDSAPFVAEFLDLLGVAPLRLIRCAVEYGHYYVVMAYVVMALYRYGPDPLRRRVRP